MVVNVRLVALASAMAILMLAEGCSTSPPATQRTVRDTVASEASSVTVPVFVIGAQQPTHYSHDEVEHFIARAKVAESFKDRMRRCLDYPDPPRSHWSRASVVAYCRYRLQTVISAAEVNALIRQGRFAALESRLQAALRAQQGDAGSPGLLDQIYEQDFSDTSDAERELLDSWKRGAPASAFAYAASGYAYTQKAVAVRGGGYEEGVPRSDIESMRRWLAMAEGDLQRAVALNPALAPAYVAWIRGANLNSTRSYVESIADRALAAVPSDYGIYDELMFAYEPEWGGSLEAMRRLAERAQVHANKNPLLRILLTTPMSVQIDHCECSAEARVAAYERLFDQLPITAYMWKEGDLAATTDPASSMIFLSETLRFLPSNPLETHALAQRSLRLTDLGHPRWALAEAKRALAQDRRFDGGYNALAWAYEALGDYPSAETALKSSIELDRTQPWPLVELGNIYVKTHQWDMAWAVDSQAVAQFPDDPSSLFMRGVIQMGQPRPGLADTVDRFARRFGSDPEQKNRLATLRDGLKRLPEKGGVAN